MGLFGSSSSSSSSSSLEQQDQSNRALTGTDDAIQTALSISTGSMGKSSVNVDFHQIDYFPDDVAFMVSNMIDSYTELAGQANSVLSAAISETGEVNDNLGGRLQNIEQGTNDIANFLPLAGIALVGVVVWVAFKRKK